MSALNMSALKWTQIKHNNETHSKLFDETLGLPDEKLPFFMCRRNGDELVGEYTLFVDGRPVALSVDVPEQHKIMQEINEAGHADVYVNYHYYQFGSPRTRLWFSYEATENTSEPDGDSGVNCRVRLSRDGKHGIKMAKID